MTPTILSDPTKLTAKSALSRDEKRLIPPPTILGPVARTDKFWFIDIHDSFTDKDYRLIGKRLSILRKSLRYFTTLDRKYIETLFAGLSDPPPEIQNWPRLNGFVCKTCGDQARVFGKDEQTFACAKCGVTYTDKDSAFATAPPKPPKPKKPKTEPEPVPDETPAVQEREKPQPMSLKERIAARKAAVDKVS